MNIGLLNSEFMKSSVMPALAFFIFCCQSSLSVAQFEGRVIRGGIMVGGAAPAAGTPVEFEDDFSGGAALKTDPDLEAIMKKAEQYRKDGNWRIATRLWQAVLERGGDALYTEDKRVYYSMTRKVESVIGKLPIEGLDMYRGTADAAATEVLAKARGVNDAEALSKVVKQFFMSSNGDDAAYRLGCLYLDKHDFVGAIRVFEKVVRDYPDPSVPMDQLYLRLAVAYAYTGNIPNANKALESARNASTNPGSPRIKQIESVINNAQVSIAKAIGDGQWTMRHGGPLRFGVMPSLPPDYLKNDLQLKWQFKFEPERTFGKNEYLGVVFNGEKATSETAMKPSQKETTTWRKWTSNHWHPAGELLLVDNKVIFKTGADMTVWNADGNSSDPIWRPALLNRFEVDDATLMFQQIKQMYGGRRGGLGPTPNGNMSIEDIMLFGDRIHQSMSVHRGVAYNIEGKEYDWTTTPRSRSNKRRNINYGALPRRTRSNFLTAYDLNTGKFLWRVPKLERLEKNKPGQKPEQTNQPEFIQEGGFMAAPIHFETMLLVPVNQGGAIWIYALDSLQQGKTVWKSYLCDEPSAGSEPWSPIVMTLDGSDLYVSCGTGVLFSVDPVTGGVRYAVRYKRQGKLDNTMARYGNQTQRLSSDGWTEDMVIPYGNWLILFASDREEVLAVDRRSGEMVWKCKFKPTIGHKVEYLIGIYDGYLYCGGINTVCAIDLEGQGRWIWGGFGDEFGGDQSFGRGFLTTEALYVPVKDSIVQLDLKTGKETNRVGVELPTSTPVGNIYSDGTRIWIHGANRLYAMKSLDEMTADEDIKDSDSVDSNLNAIQQ